MKRRTKVFMALGCYDQRLHEGIARYASEHQWQLISTCERRNELPKYWHGEGLIINYWGNEEVLRVFSQNTVHMVSLCEQTYTQDMAVVTQDNPLIGQRAAEHLLERGYENFAVVVGTDQPLCDERRCGGFMEAIKEAGCQGQLIQLTHDNHIVLDDPFNPLIQKIKQMNTPLGVFCPSDYLGAELIDACFRNNLAVPEQLAVVSAGNHSLITDNAAIGLSSVDGNYAEWGYTAAKQLDKLIKGEPCPDQPIRVKPGKVVKRTSSDILAINHLGVAKAVRYIWENFHEPIDVTDVVDAVGPMTRRGLEKAFRTHINRSPAQEILRKRLEYAKQLIIQNEHKSYEIAKLCGFRDADHLRDVFNRHIGMAPRAFRQHTEAQNKKDH